MKKTITFDPKNNFSSRVEHLVSQIPKGKVMTFGQIAAICGNPRAARIVGGIAHFGDKSLPWQRVVKKTGSLAEGYPGGIPGHQFSLEADGVILNSENRVDMSKYLWEPIL